MIAYSDDDYTMLNYKDSASLFHTLYRINAIITQEVSTPQLGSNSVRVESNGDLTSSGSPYGGGEIYLQSKYCAINYKKNTAGFTIYKSADFKPQEKWAKIFPTRHYSTPIARMLKECPTSVVLMPNGSLATYEDSSLYGLEADYLAISNGELIGAFGVKSRHYMSLFYPTTENDIDYKALIDFCIKQGDGCEYTVAGEVTGLVATSAVKEETKRIRNLMRSYVALNVDYTKATAFAAPVSAAISQTAVVNSALNLNATRVYLQQREDALQKDEKVVAMIFELNQFIEMVVSCGVKNSFLEIINDEFADQTLLCLVDSDFQAILNHYNLIYNKVKAETAYAQFKLYAGQYLTAMERINSIMPNHVTQFVKDALAKTSLGDYARNLQGTLPAIMKVDNLNCPAPIGDGSDSGVIMTYALGVIQNYGDDAEGLDDPDADLETTEGVNTYTGYSDSQVKNSKLYGRCMAAQLEKFYDAIAKFKFNDRRVAIEQRTTTNGKRCGECPVDWKFGNYTPKHYKTHKLNTSGHARLEVKSLVIKNTSVTAEVKVHVGEAVEYDQAFPGEVEPLLRTCYSTIAAEANDRFPGCSISLGTLHTGRHQYGPVDLYQEWKASKNRDFWFTFHVTLSFPGFNYPTPIGDRAGITERLAKLGMVYNPVSEEVISKRMQKANHMISTVAANAAYEQVAYLFKQCADSYEYQPIGMFGSSYEGVVVHLADLGRVADISEEYINNIVTLISSIEDEFTRSRLVPYAEALKKAQADWKTQGRIYYATYDQVMNASPLTNVNAIRHYVLGGLSI